MDVYKITELFNHINVKFPKNSKRKNYFLAACLSLDETICLPIVSIVCPFGGTIGIDDSCLDLFFKFSKVLRLHAILHDAAGYMKTNHDIGPGYSYVTGGLPNSCFLGHLTGILYCLYLKLFSPVYKNIHC